MATTDLTSALDEAGVSYELLPHAHTESALAEAQALGVSPDDVAKTLVAIREDACFEPDGEWQQAELERIYDDSGRIETYLGDWHSHPIGVARPSRRDRRTAARIARDRHARCANPLTLIVGKSWRDDWEFAPFIYRGWRGFLKVSLETYRR